MFAGVQDSGNRRPGHDGGGRKWAKNVNCWTDEERDIYRDYRNAFGDEPPMISGVAIMTDTDNTAESATAYYGDIRFHKKRRRKERPLQI